MLGLALALPMMSPDARADRWEVRKEIRGSLRYDRYEHRRRRDRDDRDEFLKGAIVGGAVVGVTAAIINANRDEN